MLSEAGDGGRGGVWKWWVGARTLCASNLGARALARSHQGAGGERAGARARVSGARGAGAGAGWPRSRGSYLVAAEVVVVALLDVAELPLQGLLGAAHRLELDALGLQLAPVLGNLFLGRADGLLVLLGRLGELGVAALEPLFRLVHVLVGVALELGADFLQRRRDVCLQVVFALHGDV